MTRPQGPYDLIGLADPGGFGLGFLIPVFGDRRSNAPLVQRADRRDRVTGFDPLDPPGVHVVPQASVRIARGDPIMWAFALAPDSILMGNDDAARSRLIEALDDPRLRGRPLLAMELAEFLDLPERRAQFAMRAYHRFLDMSEQAACGWRDLSVLTPDIRRYVARNPNPKSVKALTVLTAAIEEDAIVIRGLAELPDANERTTLRKAANMATAMMPGLYDEPPSGWRLRVIVPATDATGAPQDAAVLVANPELGDLVHELRASRALSLAVFGADDLDEFAKKLDTSGLPSFIAFDSRAPDAFRRISQGAFSGTVVGIELGRRASSIANFVPAAFSRDKGRVIAVPGAGIARTRQHGSGHTGAVQLAAAIGIEISRPGEKLEMPHPVSALLRARGTGIARDADAWASLYDRAWSLDLVPWESVLIAPSIRTMPRMDDRHPDWAIDALFTDAPRITADSTDAILDGLRTTAALLVSSNRRDESDERRHQYAVAAMLKAQGWDVDTDAQMRNLQPFTAEGERARLRVSVDEGVPASRGWNLSELLGRELGSIDQIRVTCKATPGAVLAHLAATGELAVNMRDLCDLQAGDATVFSLAGAQLRRMVTSLHARARSHFLAVLVAEGLRRGYVNIEGAGALHEALASPALGHATHFVARRIGTGVGHVSAEIGLVASARNEHVPADTDLVPPFRLIVADEGVTIASA